jgi:tellurite resistance protein
MTPGEKNIVKALIAVAWADGHMEDSESSVVEGLLVGFDASADEERELLDYAKTRRSLDQDIPLLELSEEDKELLLANASLLAGADGLETVEETAVLSALGRLLGFSADKVKLILSESSDGALSLSSRTLSQR